MSENTASATAMDGEGAGGTKIGTRSRKRKGKPEPSFNMDELRELADLVIEHGFTDFEFENENIRVRLSKTISTLSPAAYSAPPSTPPVPNAHEAAPVQETPSESEAEPDADLYKITSPIVGTFYRAPGPEKEPYVNEGSKVSPETTVCIVEAMKLMNEIQAEVSGEIVRIYVENGQPVEYGQPLFGVRK
jgi:acetyl-CoA carboxylase biotin carboxyl carrier protein